MTKSGKKQADIRMSLFSSVEEVQNFVLWAKKNGLQSFRAGDVEFHISETARAVEYSEGISAPGTSTSEEKDTKASLLDSEPEQADDDEDLLYHSTI